MVLYAILSYTIIKLNIDVRGIINVMSVYIYAPFSIPKILTDPAGNKAVMPPMQKNPRLTARIYRYTF